MSYAVTEHAASKCACIRAGRRYFEHMR